MDYLINFFFFLISLKDSKEPTKQPTPTTYYRVLFGLYFRVLFGLYFRVLFFISLYISSISLVNYYTLTSRFIGNNN